MLEAEPDGIPLSTPMFPLPPETALGVLGGILAIVARAHASGELVYVGAELEVTGIAPRAELFASTMRESLRRALRRARARGRRGAERRRRRVLRLRVVPLRAHATSALLGQHRRAARRDARARRRGSSSIAVLSPAVASAVQAGVARRPESRPTAKELLALLREHGRADAHAHDDDPNQRAEYERELAWFERTRGIRPSKL